MKEFRFLHKGVILSFKELMEKLNLNDEKADEVYSKYSQFVAEISDEILKEAIKFRKKVYKDKKISYVDAIGYTYALKNNLVFLTGDKEFENLKNVEFVKK